MGYEKCTEQFTKKYTSRPGPPYPANQCCGLDSRGNDNQMYKSTRNSNGVCTWKPIFGRSFFAASKRASKKPAVRKSKVTKKPAARKSKKRVSKKRVSKKRVSKKRVSKKRR